MSGRASEAKQPEVPPGLTASWPRESAVPAQSGGDTIRALRPIADPIRPTADSRPPARGRNARPRPSANADRGLMLVDFVTLVAACLAAVATDSTTGTHPFGWAVGFAVACMCILHVRGFYRFRLGAPIVPALGQIVIATALAAMLLISVGTIATISPNPADLAARLWIYSTVFFGGARIGLGLQARSRWARSIDLRATLVIGAGNVGRLMARRLRSRPELGMDPIGYIDDDPRPASGDDIPVLGGIDDLAAIVDRHAVTHVIITFSLASDEKMRELMRSCREHGAEVLVVPRIYEEMTNRLTIEHVGGIPLLHAEQPDPRGWQFALKYAIDRVFALALLALLGPVLLVIALLVRLSSPGPIFFRQPRAGLDGREFTMLKFRSMRGSPDDGGEADAAWAARIRGEVRERRTEVDRTTRIGKVLRRSSLDELPQLLNVLRGDMSLVGPRPERTSYARDFESFVYRYGDRHRVKSGITGWAQVQQLRGETSLADRVEWDNYYIENWSLPLDLKILLLTIPAAARGTGSRARKREALTKDREQAATASR